MTLRLTWKSEDDSHLEEALSTFGARYLLIERKYGPDGNGKLSRFVESSRIRTRAHSIANARLASNINLGAFACVIAPKIVIPKITPIQDDEDVKLKNFVEWTPEDDASLLEGYAQFDTRWKEIAQAHPNLHKHYCPTRFRERLYKLQKAALLSDQEVPLVLMKPIPGYEDKFHRNFIQLNRKLSIQCPNNCKEPITEAMLLVNGLQCTCDIDVYSLTKVLTSQFKHVTYIISNKGNSLTDPIQYVGVTNDLTSRLKQHVEKWMHDLNLFTIRVSLRINEHTAINLFSPAKNDSSTCVRIESLQCRLTDSTSATTKEVDIRLLNHVHTYFCKTSKMPHEHWVNENVGLLFRSLAYDIDLTYCYIAGKDVCTCSLPCRIRALRNRGLGLALYHPLTPDVLRPRCALNLERPNIDYLYGFPCEPSKLFFTNVLQRNRSIQEKTRIDYTTMITKVLDLNFIQEGIYPDLFYSTLRNYFGYASVTSYLKVIMIFLNQIAPHERVILYGETTYITMHNLYSLFMNECRRTEQIQRAKTKVVPTITYQQLLTITESSHDQLFESLPFNYAYLQQHIALLLHVKQPIVRKNFRSVILSDYCPETDDYLDMNKKLFVFHEQQLDKSYYRYTSPISDEVLQDLSVLVNFRLRHKQRFLFLDSKSKQISPTKYSQLILDATLRVSGTRILYKLLSDIVQRHILSLSQ